MGAVTIASTLQRQLPNDPWNLRPNQLVLINPDDYSPLQPVQVVKNLRSTKEYRAIDFSTIGVKLALNFHCRRSIVWK